jgi:hypothetical protein
VVVPLEWLREGQAPIVSGRTRAWTREHAVLTVTLFRPEL